MKYKKIVLLLLITIASFILASCKKGEIIKVDNIQEFDKIISKEGALLYDIRSIEECSEGHIPYFMCMGNDEGEEKDLLKIANNIEILYKDHNKTIVIVGLDQEVLELLNILLEKGYKKLYYFEGGYLKYASLKGEDFIPEEGCAC